MLAFLKKLLGLGPSFRSTFEANPVLTPLVAAMKGNNIQPAYQLFASADPDLRLALIEAAGRHYCAPESRMTMVEAWVKGSPKDIFGRLLAVEVRGNSIPGIYPDDSEAEKSSKIAARSELRIRLEKELDQLAAESPADPLPHTMRMALPGGGRDPDAARRAYQEAIRRAPDFFAAHRNVVQALESEDDVDDLARSIAQSAKPGTDLPILLVYAHLSKVLHEKFWGDGDKAAKELIEDRETVAEVNDALAKSIDSAQYQTTHYTLWARHVAAAWMISAEDNARARGYLEKVGDSFDENAPPWNLDVAGFTETRARVGL